MANLAVWAAAAALLFSYKLVLLHPEGEQALPASVGQFALLSIAGAARSPRDRFLAHAKGLSPVHRQQGGRGDHGPP
jgi:hypothetical protein